MGIETSQEYTKKEAVDDLIFIEWQSEEALRTTRLDTVMQKFYANTESACGTVMQEKDTRAWEFLQSMIENSYFERSWIIQELVLVKNQIIQFGSKTFDAKPFFGAVVALTENPWLVGETSAEVVFIKDPLSRWWKLSLIVFAHRQGLFRLPLGSLLYDLRGKKASQDRDQISSLIGIATYMTFVKPLDCWGRTYRPRLANPRRGFKDLEGIEKWYYAIFYGFKNGMAPPIVMDIERATHLIYRDTASFILKNEQSLALLSQVNSASQKLQSEPEWPS